MMRFKEFIKLEPKRQVDLPKRKDASNIQLPSNASDPPAVLELMRSPTTSSSDDTCAPDSSQDQVQ